ncbi:MAG TPA: hypothetical protein VG847_12330 [Chitinophagaceae bacterium]|nr:hypothetical protein [Chitinophagaceae bacterium]
MIKRTAFILFLAGAVLIYSCSHKSHPSTSVNTTANTEPTSNPAVKKKAVSPLPKVISVNDSAARKSTDGRLYYDVMGHRYWKNYKDGKYYLFNKSMYNNPAFKNSGQ